MPHNPASGAIVIMLRQLETQEQAHSREQSSQNREHVLFVKTRSSAILGV